MNRVRLNGPFLGKDVAGVTKKLCLVAEHELGSVFFPCLIVYITIDNYFLTMVIGNREEEGRVCMNHSIHRSLEKA